MNEMVKPQVLQFWGFYQHSTSLLYVHLHTNWKTKKRTDVQLLSKQQKKAPNKAYQYSESVSHLSVSELPPPSPRHILRPPSFPRPAESSRSAGLLLPTLPRGRCSMRPTAAAHHGGQPQPAGSEPGCRVASEPRQHNPAGESWQADTGQDGQGVGITKFAFVGWCCSPAQALSMGQERGLV